MKNKIKQTQVSAVQSEFHNFKGDLLLLGFFKDCKQVPAEYKSVDAGVKGALSGVLGLNDFSGALCETAVIYPAGKNPVQRWMLVGLGERGKFELNILRQSLGTAIRQTDKLGAAKVGLCLPQLPQTFKPELVGQAVSEGIISGRYDFQEFFTDKKENKQPAKMQVTLLEPTAAAKKINEGCKVGSIIAEGQNVARAVANQPGNVINPPALAREAQSLARQYGLRCKIFDDRQLDKMKMNAILAVGNSSAHKPRLILLEYNGRGKKSVGPDVIVVGKAVTFDSGGIDLKPSQNMDLMKYDKSGGCAVLGIMAAVAKLKLPRHVIGLIPSAENLLSSTCYRPGDIVTTANGKTVEIMSTDAEGRMLLADALNYAVKMKPRVMIDLATLTGACAVALGEHYAGLFGNDDALIEKLRQAGQASGERLWPMPSGPDYLDQMKSKYADLKNAGVREGAACAAAAFLNEFVEGIPWAHLDIACVAKPDTEKSFRSPGATGFGVRVVVEYLRSV
jgi:leucyl aminopeptidase